MSPVAATSQSLFEAEDMESPTAAALLLTNVAEIASMEVSHSTENNAANHRLLPSSHKARPTALCGSDTKDVRTTPILPKDLLRPLSSPPIASTTQVRPISPISPLSSSFACSKSTTTRKRPRLPSCCRPLAAPPNLPSPAYMHKLVVHKTLEKDPSLPFIPNQAHSRIQKPRTIVKRNFSWSSVPELENFLQAHCEDYKRQASKGVRQETTVCTDLMLDVLQLARTHGYELDEDVTSSLVRDSIRNYYRRWFRKSKQQSSSKKKVLSHKKKTNGHCSSNNSRSPQTKKTKNSVAA